MSTQTKHPRTPEKQLRPLNDSSSPGNLSFAGVCYDESNDSFTQCYQIEHTGVVVSKSGKYKSVHETPQGHVLLDEAQVK